MICHMLTPKMNLIRIIITKSMSMLVGFCSGLLGLHAGGQKGRHRDYR